MKSYRPASRQWWAQIVTHFITAATLVRLLLTEQSWPDRKMFSKARSPNGLTPEEKRYMEWLQHDYVQWLIQTARGHLIKYKILMYVSGISALAISLVEAYSGSS
jgi:hypothetical protein